MDYFEYIAYLIMSFHMLLVKKSQLSSVIKIFTFMHLVDTFK